MRHAQHWSVSLLAGVILSAVAIPSLAQDKDSETSHEESPSLAAAVELAETGDLTEVEINQLALRLGNRADLSITDQPAHVQADLDLDDSQALVSGKTKSNGQIELLVQVDNIAVDAIYDPADSTLHMDGHGHRFSVKDILVLQTLAVKLEKEGWDSIWKETTQTKQLAYNLLNLLAAAPVNYELPTRTIDVAPSTSPENAQIPPQRPSHRVASGVEAGGDSSLLSLNGECVSEDPVLCTNLDTINVGLLCEPPHEQLIRHTACDEHGRCSRYEVVGRNVNNCLGRCGLGCGTNAGYGRYYLDCAAHDSCCRIHGGCANPVHALCGDEYAAAAPEFFASKNCTPPPPPPPCLPVIEETTTWALGPSGGPVVAYEQLQFGLHRYARRPETFFYLEEWAILSVDGGVSSVRSASTDAFGARVAASAVARVSSYPGDATTALVVESAEHPQNGRHVPAPAFEPFAVQLERGEGLEPQQVWFRAEADAAGQVDHMMLLEASPTLAREAVEEAIRDNVRLHYTDDRRHRTVVFGAGNITDGGRLTVDSALVLVVRCCTCVPEPIGGPRAPCVNCRWDPEYGWICA